MMVVGVAWIAFYYLVVRPDPNAIPAQAPGGPSFMGNMGRWNYTVGFGLFFVGLLVSAHPSTPLGRGRGVVVGMLTCFILGLLWICTFYVHLGRQHRQGRDLQRPQPVEPGRRHLLHGGGLLLRHALGVSLAACRFIT